MSLRAEGLEEAGDVPSPLPRNGVSGVMCALAVWFSGWGNVDGNGHVPGSWRGCTREGTSELKTGTVSLCTDRTQEGGCSPLYQAPTIARMGGEEGLWALNTVAISVPCEGRG